MIFFRAFPRPGRGRAIRCIFLLLRLTVAPIGLPNGGVLTNNNKKDAATIPNANEAA